MDYRKIISACMIGNALEWYDFVIYGFFTSTLGKLFFPSFNPFAQLLAVWGIFWFGFIVRPLGGIFFGYLGDKFSRKMALTYSIFMMVLPTTLMGFLPSFDTIGIAAPIILVILRLMQGFAMGGEFTGSIIFLVEHAPSNKRCWWGSFATFSVVTGVLVGSLVTTFVTNMLSHDEVLAWGWRIPFIISIIGGLVGIYIRTHLQDPNIFIQLKEIKEQSHLDGGPLKNLLIKYKTQFLLIILIDVLTAVGFYLITIYLPTYFNTIYHFDASTIFIFNTINMVLFACSILVGGKLGDKFGRKTILGVSAGLIILFSYPLFLLIDEHSYLSIFMMQAILVLIYGLYQGTFPTTIAELMPISTRYSGVSLAHSLSMAVFGGSTPFMATWLIKTTGIITAPAFMLIAAGIISAVGISLLRE